MSGDRILLIEYVSSAPAPAPAIDLNALLACDYHRGGTFEVQCGECATAVRERQGEAD